MYTNKIFDIQSDDDFLYAAIETFRYQYEHISVYREFCDLLKTEPSQVKEIQDIPFLPIEIFKSHKVIAENRKAQTVFVSSGTTGQITSRHYVADLHLYERSFTHGFNRVYGLASNYTILALLPSYLERKGSSLIYMVNHLIEQSSNPHSGFYLNEIEALAQKLRFLEKQGQKTLLIGVSYALLDLIEMETFDLKNTVIMETGGMKGRRKELVKAEFHNLLKEGFGVQKIHSEYGMTELLSQAYSTGDGIFQNPPWMKILTRDTEDARSYVSGKTGGINVIDLANIYSCAFIATQDLGRAYDDNRFEILGRFSSSDVRGCNLLVL